MILVTVTITNVICMLHVSAFFFQGPPRPYILSLLKTTNGYLEFIITRYLYLQDLATRLKKNIF